ncbi:sugar transferase [Catenulispora yoronensis]
MVLVLLDWACAALATWATVPHEDDWPAMAVVPAAWVGVTCWHRLYERRHVGPGTEEYHRLLRSCLAAMAALAAAYALLGQNDRLVRGVLLAVPAAAVGSLLARKVIRALSARRVGLAARPALLVGTAAQCSAMADILRRERSALRAVAALDVGGPGGYFAGDYDDPSGPHGVPIIGDLTADGGAGDAEQVALALEATGCEAVVLMPGPHLGAAALSRLGWRLANQGTDILVAPFLSEIAPARLAVRRDGGVPLLHVRAPRLSRGARVPKDFFERAMAAVGIILLAPVFLAVSLAILIGDGRPVYFRQRRVGLRGEPFTLFKFRTMASGPRRRRWSWHI